MTITSVHNIVGDLHQHEPMVNASNRFKLIADTVMGGVSSGTMRQEKVAGRESIRLQGSVSLENNGGFLQIAIDLNDDESAMNVQNWTGIRLDVLGNNETYNLHLRTSDLKHSWESYRQSFVATATWNTVTLPFSNFNPHRTECPLNLKSLRRIGIVAIGRQFEADVSITDIRFY